MNKERPPINLFFLFIPAVVSSVISGGDYVTAIPCLIVIIYSYFNKFHFPRNSFTSTLSCLMIVGVSLLLHSFIITDLPTGNGPHIMAASMIVLIVYLWYYQNPKLTSNIITLLCLLIMIFTGNNFNDDKSTYPTIIYLFIPCVLGYLFSLNNYLSKKNLVVLLIGIIGIFFSSHFLNKFLFFADEKLNIFLQDIISSSNSSTSNNQGFSNQVEIQTQIDLKLSTKPVILLKAKNIQYLRAEVLENYSRKSWSGIQKTSKNPYKFKYNDKDLLSFELIDQNKSIINQAKLGNITFLNRSKNISLPINAYAFSEGNYKIKPYNTVISQDLTDSLDFYTVNKRDLYYKPENNETDIDKSLADSLRALTMKITAKDTDNLSKAQSIQNYFSSYKYSLNVNFTGDKEPIVDFVFNQKSGFCLHFASSMALMMRSIGIPAHVVTGYIVSERNNFLDAYIIRERDAHAWVEVYDSKTNLWKTFDPTPSAQMAEYMQKDSSFFDDVSLYFKAAVLKLKSFFSIFSIENLTKLSKSPYLFIVLLLATLYIVFRNYNFKSKKSSVDLDTQKFLLSLNKELKNYKISLEENMTYTELIEKINTNETIDLNSKQNVISKIEQYQTNKYTR